MKRGNGNKFLFLVYLDVIRSIELKKLAHEVSIQDTILYSLDNWYRRKILVKGIKMYLKIEYRALFFQ